MLVVRGVEILISGLSGLHSITGWECVEALCCILGQDTLIYSHRASLHPDV